MSWKDPEAQHFFESHLSHFICAVHVFMFQRNSRFFFVFSHRLPFALWLSHQHDIVGCSMLFTFVLFRFSFCPQGFLSQLRLMLCSNQSLMCPSWFEINTYNNNNNNNNRLSRIITRCGCKAHSRCKFRTQLNHQSRIVPSDRSFGAQWRPRDGAQRNLQSHVISTSVGSNYPASSSPGCSTCSTGKLWTSPPAHTEPTQRPVCRTMWLWCGGRSCWREQETQGSGQEGKRC